MIKIFKKIGRFFRVKKNSYRVNWHDHITPHAGLEKSYIKRINALKKQNTIIEIDGSALESDIEKVLYKLIADVQIKASEEGLEYLFYDNEEDKRIFKNIVYAWAGQYRPKFCALCGSYFAVRFKYWCVDANGNIVHPSCFYGK